MEDEGRISRGWRLTLIAWNILLHDRTALILAVLQGISALVLTTVTFVISGWFQHPGQETRLLLAVVITYLPSTFVATFIGVALCAAVSSAMDGGRLTLAQALAVPARRLGQVFVWSLLATGVGLLLEQLVARLPFGGRVLTWLAGVAWSIGTLFVLPILALEGCNAGECAQRSAHLVKQRWGEAVTGNLVIGAWAVVIGIPLGIAIAVINAVSDRNGGYHPPETPWLIVLAVLVVVSSFTWAAARVFSVALYRYASAPEAAGPFPEADLSQPFRRRREATVSQGSSTALSPQHGASQYTGSADRAPLQEWLKRRRQKSSTD